VRLRMLIARPANAERSEYTDWLGD
jgi:hypothetical protein